MRIVPFLILLFVIGCSFQKPPTVQYSQYTYSKTVRLVDDQLVLELQNPLHCPLRVWIFDKSKSLESAFNSVNPVVLNGRSDTLMVFPGNGVQETDIRFVSRLGDHWRTVEEIKVSPPFPKGKTYRVIQGNNSDYTHNTDWSRYALDLDLKIGDTICSATGGYVVGVVDQYTRGGVGDEWRPFGNFITVYEPNSGIFTQYVHLVEKGSLVQVGDSLKRGQPIGLSGKTGQTNVEHLHFNVLVPENTNLGLKSIPFEFLGGDKSTSLKRNDKVGH